MAGSYSHLMITDVALERFQNDQTIDPQLRGFALARSHFVHLGTLSPDYPYLDFFQPRQEKWADSMHHRHTGDVIQTMAQRLLQLAGLGLQDEEFVIPFCWTLGYISHVTADLVVHPVVMNIVGPYEGNEARHRHCEMIQDAFIYSRIRTGAEIEHSGLTEIIQICSDSDDKDKIHPILRLFWDNILRTYFPGDYREDPPDINQWHDQFEDWLGLAGRPAFLGRIIDPEHEFTYKTSREIEDDERRSYLVMLPLPQAGTGSYEEDVFPKAAERVTEKWVHLSAGISRGNLEDFLSGITNCDLDTGRDLQTGKLVYW